MDNLYPYVHLFSIGQLFIFANTKVVLYDYNTNTVVNNYAILDGGPRSNELPLGKIVCDVVVNWPNSVWEMENMPFGRIMGDMVMLPTGDVLIKRELKALKWLLNRVCFSVLYRPSELIGMQFMTLNPGSVPRMYHSTTKLFLDRRVLIAGSNLHYFYKLSAEFPTELRIEAFSPKYLS
ncbi:glyoxal oxidase-related protein [Abeliophyllum distichum]|uniref:Glyoxal oxidase-related protein n=1 Tax=Abeliophyllum distichum TaxID=126358 RepID=A0ABD1VT56_9LAMI